MRTPEPAGIDTATPAVVFKLDPNALHHGGLGLIRSLGRAGVPVYAVHEDPMAPAAHSRYLRGRWWWRPELADPERINLGLAALAEKLGRPAVLFPTDDAAAIHLAEHGAALRHWFRFPDPPPELPREVAGKFTLQDVCRDLGIQTPRAELVRTRAEAAEFAAETGYPLVAKLATPWTSGGRAKVRSTSILRTPRDLRELGDAWDEQETEQQRAGLLMLQEYVPGGSGNDWFFHAYRGSGGCRPAFTGVKLRSYPAHAGLTTLGRCLSNTVLRAQATELLRRLDFRGIADLDFRFDRRDGSYRLLDFNPRLGAQFRLFRDSAGIDVVLAAYLDLTGQPVPEGLPPVGRRFLVENYDPLGAVGYWRRGDLGLRQWIRSVWRADELAWFARDDLAPFALMCGWMGRRALTRRFAPRTGVQVVEPPRYRERIERDAGAAIRQRRRSPYAVEEGHR
ncbi:MULTISPECIES: carboxylate--amine ligase [unclassified Saccharopolyspora]|uniref:carboxylate--amine ligase n=1 Tax=unclassified Saccharopolyspora TaxID=2646250 RepID=UPI001CD63FCC|nr:MULTISPECIES: carboxylate--amine ligase [unclassified Saccharopolyspora]MCA1189925.1 carboxylate--amine ligase [Saccharopolyspora sp. 6T]MCA1195832.1 carboxylate--amine ligase [Saccharopolyspora sp. 6V]MCA1283275.1 carboxylate--amine ligase [Saccharopolyspora sp. 7B]